MHNDMKHSDRNEYSQQVYAYLANIRSVMKYVAHLHRCAGRSSWPACKPLTNSHRDTLRPYYQRILQRHDKFLGRPFEISEIEANVLRIDSKRTKELHYLQISSNQTLARCPKLDQLDWIIPF